MPPDDLNPPRKKKVGFALMSPERRRELGRKGGLNMPNEKRPFVANRALAVAAGQKGGRLGHGGGRPKNTYTDDEKRRVTERIRRVSEYTALHNDPLHPANRKP